MRREALVVRAQYSEPLQPVNNIVKIGDRYEIHSIKRQSQRQ